MPFTVEDRMAGDMVAALIRIESLARPGWRTFPGIGKMSNPFSGLDLGLDL